MHINLRVEAAVVLRAEVAEGRPLVVDEKTAETDGRFLRNIPETLRKREFAESGGFHVKPVDERRNAEHLGKMEQSVNGAALLTARDDNRSLKASLSFVYGLLRNVLHNGNREHLASVLNLRKVNHARFREAVNQLALSDGSEQNRHRHIFRKLRALKHLRSASEHCLHIIAYASGNLFYAAPFPFAADKCHAALLYCSCRNLEFHAVFSL